MLIDGNLLSIASSFFVATSVFTRSFFNVTSNSVAAPLTPLEGDDMRLMAGNTNKSSSYKIDAVLSISYPAVADVI